jgi:glycosyltransferase involved in cell wall biosynthesis
VLPSRRESFGLVFLEAMASRCPLVGSNVGGIPEVVLDGETGSLVPFDSPELLAAAVIELLTDTDKAHRFACAGRQRVETLFSAERMARQYNTLYLDLLTAKGPRSLRART